MRRSGGHEVKPTSLSDTYHGRIRLDITDSPDGGVVAGIDKLCFAKDGCRLMREEEAQIGRGGKRASERATGPGEMWCRRNAGYQGQDRLLVVRGQGCMCMDKVKRKHGQTHAVRGGERSVRGRSDYDPRRDLEEASA
jgi:hypothetical protein